MLFSKRSLRRISKLHWLMVAAILGNLVVYLLMIRQQPSGHNHINPLDSSFDLKRDYHKKDGSLTVLINNFEDFDNRVVETTKRIKSAVPRAEIVVIHEKFPYPPLNLPHYAKLLILTPPLSVSMIQAQPQHHIDTEYVVFLPDASEIITEGSLQIMLDTLTEDSDFQMVAWPATPDRDVKCHGLTADLKHWTLKYSRAGSYCDALSGHFVLVIFRKYLFQLSQPFKRPFEKAFFIQTALKGWKIKFFNDFTYRRIDKLFTSGHNLWKHQDREQKRIKKLYSDFGIKLVHHENGDQEWYGCHKHTSRCFGTIVNDMPEYIYNGRYTPPCCLKALRKTALHVISIFQANGVRFWLEGGSLLGAARSGDIIPWDYDIDLGMYKSDILKCEHLLKTDLNSYEDDQGFLWERSSESEGDFFRVHYSSSNRIHVDIFPFYPKAGNMTKDYWFKSHPQDVPFPEHYLKPMTTINFIGMPVPAPNNWKSFLELKFGTGVIENPKFPVDVNISSLW